MAGKILIIDSVMPNRIILKVKLSGAGYDVAIAASGREGLDMVAMDRPDMIILDMDLPDISVEGMMSHLRSTPNMQNVLVMMVSANTSTETRLRAYRAGCDEFYGKPYNETTLLARVRSFFREDEQLRVLAAKSAEYLPYDFVGAGLAEEQTVFEQPASILILGDLTAAMRLRRKLPDRRGTTVSVLPPEQVLNGASAAMGQTDAVIVVSDNADPNAALHLISFLRGRPQTRDARFCVLFDENARLSDRDLAFDFGADAIIRTDDDAQEVALRLAGLIKRKHRADALRERIKTGLMMSMRDPLTNIANRRYMIGAMTNFITKAQRDNGSVAVIICDVDRFKSINDRFGHAIGDQVLREVATRLSEVVREGDLVARIGGEEFLIALPNANMGDARAIAERLVAAIGTKAFIFENAPPLIVTISAGLAMAIPTHDMVCMDVINQTLDEADKAMLLSKQRGRNKITMGRSAA